MKKEKKRERGKEVEIPLEIYKIGILFLLGGTDEWTAKRVKRITGQEYDPDCDGRMYKKKGGYWPVVIIQNMQGARGWITAVHEIIHCVNYIFMERGIKLDYENDEPFTYLVSHILHKLNDKINYLKK